MDAVEVRSIRNSNQFQIVRRKDFPFRVLHFQSGGLSEKEQRYMRFEKPIMTSRREFLSNALGIALVTASTWPIRADQARSMHGQSDSSTANSGRTTQNIPLRWDVFLAPSIPAITSDLPPGEKERPWPPISSTVPTENLVLAHYGSRRAHVTCYTASFASC